MTMYRKHSIDREQLKTVTDSADRVISMAFSSEQPYERWWGIEVLDHNEKSVRLGRLNDGASVLFNHDWNDLRGAHVPGTTKIGADKVLRGDVRLTAATQAGRDAIALVDSGVLSKASIGYQIHKVLEQSKKKDGSSAERELDGALFERVLERSHEQARGDVLAFRRALDAAAGKFERADDAQTVYRVVDWEPYENSLVTVPADASVGVGRAAEQSGTVHSINAAARDTGANTPAGEPAATQGAVMAEVANAPAGAPAEPQFSAQDYEKARVRAIEFFCKANKIDERAKQHWIASGATLETVGEEILRISEERGKASTSTAIGLTANETKRFSMWRAIQAVSSGDWSDAGLELAASRAVAERIQRSPRKNSFFVPLEVQQRDASVAGTGAYLVATNNVSFVELLRNRMVVRQMGATVLGGLVGNVTIPKQTAGATAYWLASETTQITEGNQTFGQLALSPKTVGAYTEVSRLLQLQSSPDIDGLVMSDLAKQVAIAADLAALNGSGSAGQPAGLIGTSGAGAVSMGTFDYADILNFQEDVAAANALQGALGYVTTPAVASLCMQRVKFASTASPLWEGNLSDGTMYGYKAMSSNQIPSGDMIFGDWSQLVIGEWGVLELAVDDKANFQAGISGIRCFYTMDVGVRVPAAFSIGTSAS